MESIPIPQIPLTPHRWCDENHKPPSLFTRSWFCSSTQGSVAFQCIIIIKLCFKVFPFITVPLLSLTLCSQFRLSLLTYILYTGCYLPTSTQHNVTLSSILLWYIIYQPSISCLGFYPVIVPLLTAHSSSWFRKLITVLLSIAIIIFATFKTIISPQPLIPSIYTLNL